MSELCVCVGVRTNEPSAEGWLDVLKATPLIVTRFRFSGSQGVGRESDGESAAILELAHVQAKVLRREWGGAEGWFSVVEAGAWATELASGRVGRVPALA